MTPYVQSVIICAWRQNSLAALHIDLEPVFHSKVQDPVFKTVASFSSRLRPLDVRNIWVALTDKDSDIPDAAVNVELYQSSNQDPNYHLSPMSGAEGYEDLVTKSAASAFAQPPLERLLDRTGITAIFTDGVSGPVCVAETLIDGIRLDKYDFIVVDDAVYNGEGETIAQRVKRLYGLDSDIVDRRLHSSNSREIMQTLWGTALAL